MQVRDQSSHISSPKIFFHPFPRMFKGCTVHIFRKIPPNPLPPRGVGKGKLSVDAIWGNNMKIRKTVKKEIQ
jgi:hypothetical protein